MRRSTPLLRFLQLEEQEEGRDDDEHEGETLKPRKKRHPGQEQEEGEESEEGEAEDELVDETNALAILSAARQKHAHIGGAGGHPLIEITPARVKRARALVGRPGHSQVEQWQRAILAEASPRYQMDLMVQLGRRARGEKYATKLVNAFHRGYGWNYSDVEDHRGKRR